MSDDEIRRQKVDLTIQVEDSQKRLHALREKATARANRIIDFGNRLKRAPEREIYRQGHSILHTQPVGDIKLLEDGDIEALQINPALEIANSIRAEIGVLADLKERLAKL